MENEDQQHFDAKAEVARIKALRETKKYRKSRLDRYRGEILAMHAEGAVAADIALWLRERKIKTDGSTVHRYLEKQKVLLALTMPNRETEAAAIPVATTEEHSPATPAEPRIA